MRQRDDSWFRQAAPNALGVPETVLRHYAANGDSLSLAILIHVTRQQFTYFQYSTWPTIALRHILRNDYKVNARNTSPELQHEFCTLWNHIVFKAQEANDSKIIYSVLTPVFHIYITLHHDTDSAPTQFSASTNLNNHIPGFLSSYPVCKVPGHVHGNSAPTSSARAVPHDLTATPTSLPSPDPHPSSIPVTFHAIESPADVPSRDSFHPTQASIQFPRSPPTSADLATASVIRDNDSSGTTTPLPPPQTSTSAPFSSGPPSTVALQHNTDQLTPSGPSNLPSLAALNPVLNNMLPTGLSLPSRSGISQPSISPSFPGSHHSIIVTTPPGASPGMTIPPDLDASANLAPGSREGMDVLERPSMHRANTTVALDLPLQLPLPLSAIDSDVASAAPSPREPAVGGTGDHPPGPSNFRDDIV